MTAVASRRHGIVAAGQVVDLHVIWDVPVHVTGSPRVKVVLDDDTVRSVRFS